MGIRSLFPLVLAACVTAQDRYEEGRALEQQGRHAEACNAFLNALERDANYPGAREQARAACNRAVEQFMQLVDNFTASGNHTSAADQFFQVQRLHDRAHRVGIVMDLPPAYAGKRRAVFDRAIDQTIADAQRMEGNFPQALVLYERAQRLYDPPARYQELLTDARYVTLLKWTQQEFDAGHFRLAYEKAGEALAVFGERDSGSRAAIDLRARALEEGTVFVAVVPVWRQPGLRTTLPNGILGELGDRLNERLAAKPRPFLDFRDPGAVRRELRKLEMNREVLSPGRAASVGQIVEADRVVVGVLDRWEIEETGERSPREARTRAGTRVPYTLFEGERVLWARVRFRIIDTHSRRALIEAELESRRSRPIRRAQYDGDARELVLGARARADFGGRREHEVTRELERAVVRDLAERLAAAIGEELVQTLP